MFKRKRSQPASLHPYYDLEDALQGKYKRRRWFLGILILWIVGMGLLLYSPPTSYISWLHAVITVGLGGFLALVVLLSIFLISENILFGQEREEQRLLKESLILLAPYADDPRTLESIAILAERRSTRVQLRAMVPSLLVTGFVTLAVVDVKSSNIFGIVLMLSVFGTFFFLLELGRAQAAGIIHDAIEIVRYEQHRKLQKGATPNQQLLEALVLTNNGHKPAKSGLIKS
ncbi:MAG: hypothetical protein JOZ51_02855 [Chloroflexi bacterium]|nr:hypothetical protein [Chloroflexota bacterium]